MKNELKIFFTAVMFYTRIPCPSWVDHHQDYLNKATRYFPLIGWIVALGCGIVYTISQYILPINISVLLSMAAGVLLTGAFHEDGFADMCDGFGGGWTKEKILDIMKDSRSGAYGVIGTILMLLIKYTVLVHIANINLTFFLTTLFLAHTLSRYAAVYITYTASYVREDELSKAKPIAKQMNTQNFVLAGLWVIPAFVLTPNYTYIMVLLPVWLTTTYLKKYFKKWIGGYTGDCLGATQQINEVVILLTFLALWNCI